MKESAKEKQQWEVVLKQINISDTQSVWAYGVQCIGRGTIRWCWPDVDTDRERVLRLAERLNREQPEPCHYADMVLDFIEEEAAKV